MLIQSLAIIDYLDEVHLGCRFLPPDPVERAKVRGLAQVTPATFIRSTIPLPCAYIKQSGAGRSSKIDALYHHWVREGFEAIEAMIQPALPLAAGAQVTLADICLVPE